MKANLAALLLTGTLLSGCTMIPDFARPAPPVAQNWPQALPETSQNDQRAADVQWQDFFQSEAMQTVIQTALENNRDLMAAALNVEAARAQYGIQRAELMPQLNADGTASLQHQSDDLTITGNDSMTEAYEANIGVSAYELDLFGRIQSLNRAALENFLATEEAQKAVRIALISETANAYLQLLADRKALRLTKDTLKAQEDSYNLISERYQKGISARLDLARATTAVERARVNLAIYERLVAIDENALTLLMGVSDAADILARETISGEKIEDPVIMENLPVGLPSEVLLARPDIRQAEHELMAANADIGAARAAFFPRISLTSTLGFASESLSGLFSSGGAGAWSFIPRISMPIFTGGRNKANLELAEIRRNIEIAEYEQAIQTAFREVSDELVARQSFDIQLTAQRNLVDAAQEAYDISLARYETGIDSFLSVLDAQRELFTAEQDLIQVERQRLANLVTLYRVLGGGAN